MAELKPLLRTSKPYKDESFLGYMVRLATLNYYETPSWIGKRAKIHKYSLVSPLSFTEPDPVWINNLSKITRIDGKTISSLVYSPANKIGPFNLLNGHILPRYMLQTKRPRICSECLKEESYARQIWDIVPYTVCAKHNTYMIDSCPNCGKHFSWARAKIHECQCGFDLTNVNPEKSNKGEEQVSRLIYEKLYEHKKFPGVIENWKFGQFLLMLGFLCKIIEPQKVSLANRNICELSKTSSSAYNIFENWPINFYKFLSAYQSKVKRRLERKTGLVKDFGPFYIPLYNKYIEPEFNFIRKSFEDYIAIWDGGYICHSKRTYSQRWQKESKYLGLNQAAQKLGMGQQRVQRLLEAGFLKGRSVVRGQKTLYRIDKSSIDRLSKILESSLSYKEVAKILRVSMQGLRSFMDSGLVKPFLGKTVIGNDFEWVFLSKDIDDFKQKIKSYVVKDNRTEKTITLLKMKGVLGTAKLNRCDIINEIFAGRIKLYGEDLENGIDTLLFQSEELNEFIGAVSKKNRNQCLTLLETAAHLQLRCHTLRQWARKGFITASHGGKASVWLVSLKDIEAFKNNYVITGPVARYYGMHSNKLISILASLDIEPVSGPKIDGAHIYLFRRKDLEDAGYDCAVAWQKDGPYRHW